MLAKWFTVVAAILIIFGLLYATIGLQVLLVDRKVLLNWESDLYGAIMIGWGITLLLVGRVAFKTKQKPLLSALLIGITSWLVLEALASAYLGVWFNVGVDFAVLCLFDIPLIIALRKSE